MSKGEYIQTYKCRLCGEEFKDARTGSKQVADKDVFMTLFCLDAKRGAMQSSMFGIHYCKDGSVGVADFLGSRFEENNGGVI